MRYLLFLIMVFGICGFSQDSTEQKTSQKKYVEIIKKIKNKINKTLNPQKSTNVSSVFGVRGNKYDSKNGVYWKTKNSDKLDEKIKKEKESMEEISKKIESGNISEAVADLEKFIKDNPNGY
ncbi:MAG: hypothetical protein N2Z60_09885, partial [Elusimicrobiales bacterium]|nr:hypothetical protein [Elusimicrobiales bacterium]